MNIESIQAASPSQRMATPDASSPLARQEKVFVAQAPLQSEDQRAPEAGQKQFTVQDAVQHLADFVSLTTADISFSIDEKSGVQVVTVTDRQSKEVIRQFPSEEAIRIAQVLDQLQGVFLKDKA